MSDRLVRYLRAVSLGCLALVLALCALPRAGHAQESTGHAGKEGHETHGFHRNHFGGIVGAVTHEDSDESGPTLGLEYARQFHPHWSVGGFVELADTDLERDAVVGAGMSYYPVRQLRIMFGLGIESASLEAEGEAGAGEERETDLLARLAATYGFSLTPVSALGPTLMFDRSGDRWSWIAGLVMVVGF
jgi:hypothetical protein